MTTATDSFTRANEAPMAGNWTTITSETAYNLTSNAAVPSALGSDCSARYSGATWGNDQSSKADITVTGGTGGTGPGLAVRVASGARTYYRLVGNEAASNNWELSRFVGGANTSLVLFTRAFADGDEIEMRVTGPASAARIEVLHAGVSVQVFTDNSSLASGSPGIAYSSTSVLASVDDWTGTDELGGGMVRAFNPIPFMGR